MKVLVTGGTGMVGSAFKDVESQYPQYDFILLGSEDCDLTNENQTRSMIRHQKPDAIIHLAAKVGGVKGNSEFVADFYSDNIRMNTNILDAAHSYNVKKVLSLLSTCVYPDKANYPLTEKQIHLGPPHLSNFGYAYAKRMLDVQSRALRQQYGCNFICAVPNNLYGPHDNFDLENGHVIPAIIRKIWEAKHNGVEPVFWGDGKPLREFTFSQDIPRALLFLLENYDSPEPINIGNVKEMSIAVVVQKVCQKLQYNGPIYWNINQPSGQFRKPSSNINFIKLGWKDSSYVSFDEGIEITCNWFVEKYPNIRGLRP